MHNADGDARHSFTTGFFDPVARAAGETVPDELTIAARDSSLDEAFNDRLHIELHFGKFTLWPTLTFALAHLRHSIVTDTGACDEQLLHLCEQGALLFLRGVLLRHGFLPHYEWPEDATPRTCARFGEAYASFAHYDVRLPDLRLWNLWVPIAPVTSEPLLLFAGQPAAMDGTWRHSTHKARHLPPSEATNGEWHCFRDLQPGFAVIFPGDGGADDHRPIFHASAWASEHRRMSFDVRELVCATSTGDDKLALRLAAAAERQAAEVARWELEAAALVDVRETAQLRSV